MTAKRRGLLPIRQQLRKEYLATKDLEPHERPAVTGAPKRYPAARVCACGALMSIYNPGPGCSKCNAEAVKEGESILWAVRFGEPGTSF